MSLDLDLIYSKFNLKMDKSSNHVVYEFEEFRLDAIHGPLGSGGAIPVPEYGLTGQSTANRRQRSLRRQVKAIFGVAGVEEGSSTPAAGGDGRSNGSFQSIETVTVLCSR